MLTPRNSMTGLVLGAFLVARGAGAQLEPATPREQAHAHFDQGMALARSGEYERSLTEFLAAYRASPHFAVLYDIGQVYIALGRPLLAIASLEQYLREGGAQITPERRARTAHQIADQSADVSELRIAVDVSGAAIEVDGRAIGSAPLLEALRVDPGTHLLSVHSPGRPTLLRSVTLSAGQVVDVTLELPQAPVPVMSVLAASAHAEPLASAQASAVLLAGSPAIASSSAFEASSTEALRVLGYVVGGVGVALGGSAFGHYLWNRHRFGRWRAEDLALRAERIEGSYEERQRANNDLSASIQHAEPVSVGLALSGSVCLVGGGFLLLMTGGRSSTAASQTNDGSVALGVRGEW